MKPWIAAGVAFAVFALACYGVGTASQQRQRRVSRLALACLACGLLLDLLATACMVAGAAAASRGLTLHGALGYSALAGMALETALAWRHRRSRGDAPLSRALLTWSRVAYLYWLLAFLSGSMLARAAARAGGGIAG
jgi:hypothetical protein